MKQTSYNRQLSNGVWVEIVKKETSQSKSYHINATWGTPVYISYANKKNDFKSITEATRHIEDEIVYNDISKLVKQAADERGIPCLNDIQFLYVAGLAFDIQDLIFLQCENDLMKQVYNLSHGKGQSVNTILKFIANRLPHMSDEEKSFA